MKPITVSIEIPVERIANLLSCAFESGDVGYWCRLGKSVKKEAKRGRKALGKIAEDHDECVWLPLAAGCGVYVIEHNDSTEEKDWAEPVLLNLAAIKRGFAAMTDPKNEHAYHFGNWLSDNEDATTGDVFLQFCILGEVKYG